MTNNGIKELCHSFGADLVGVASVDRFVNAPKGHHPTDVMPTAKSVISLGMALPKDTLVQDIRTYTDLRNEAVQKMDKVAADVAAELKKLKHKAVSIVSLSGKFVDGRFRSRVSLKHAAELAGLGVIARNYLLTNDKYGNLLWFTAVVTSLELEPDPLATYEVCNNCNLCVDLCPSGTLSDENNFNQKGCRKVCYVTVKGVLELRCWQCRNVCPYKHGVAKSKIMPDHSQKLSEMSNEQLWALFPIVIREYNADYPIWYAEEELTLIELIGNNRIERISHIGSTAVPGLLSKPTVDILLEITQDCNVDDLVFRLEQNGYICSKQPESPPPHLMFMKGYTLQGFAEKVFHLHVRYGGDWDECYFRDYLRLHPDISQQYGILKTELQQQFEHDRDGYTYAKADFIKRHTQLAKSSINIKKEEI